MVSRKEAQKAAENLSKKTKVKWEIEERDNGNFVLAFKAIQEGGDRDTFKNKLKNDGIGFIPNTDYTKIDNESKVHNIAYFTHPLEIKALAKNEFKSPSLSSNVMRQVADKLTLNTGLEWQPSDNEIAIQYVNKGTDDRKTAAKEFRDLLIKKGVTPLPAINTQPVRGGAPGVIVVAHFSHPLEIQTLQEMKPPKKISERIITPKTAAAIYKAVTKKNRGTELDGLTNTVTPAKFSKALEILNIKTESIDFMNKGYKVMIDDDNFNKIREIENPLKKMTRGVSNFIKKFRS